MFVVIRLLNLFKITIFTLRYRLFKTSHYVLNFELGRNKNPNYNI